ncbi:retrovirus-related pol polyprotein from transposon TNT 1-94 [Tanacetum coccineum]
MNENKNLFVPASKGYDQEMVSKTKDWVERFNHDSKLPNFNTERILIPENQAVNESLKLTETLNTLESSKDSKRHIREPIWYLDSGCSRSMTGVKSYLHKYVEQPGSTAKFDAKADDGYFLGYSFVSKAFRVFNTRRQQIEETYHVTFDESMEAIRFTNTRRFTSLNYLRKSCPYNKVIAPNEPDIPHTEDTEGPLDLIKTEGTHEQNIQNDQMITQPTDISLGNNTEVSGSITESLVPIDPGEGMLTRSMATKLTAASASECLFADFLSEIEPKKVSEALNQEEGIDYDETFVPVARMEAIRIFLAFATYMNFKVYQMDVKSIFLNGKLKEEVYVKQPPGFESSEFSDYVYDIIFGSTSYKLCKQFDKLMRKKFEMSMMGELTYFLGLQIKQDDKGISIFQEQYTRNLLKRYEISNSSFMKTPMVFLPLNQLRYMKGTPTLGLYYPKCLGFDLKGYSDYAGCNMDRKSTSGACQILWMKSQLSDYDIHYKMVPIFCDNTSAIAISNNPVLHSRTKHIDIRYHFIRDHILKGDIELHFIPTEYQLADIFTKPLDEPTFTRLKAELGMLNID